MEQIVQNQWENIFRKMGKYITKSVQINKIDKETGEVMQATSQMSVEKKDSEPFFFTYSKEIMALYGKSIFNHTFKGKKKGRRKILFLYLHYHISFISLH